MGDVSGVLDALESRSVESRYEATEAIRETIIGLRNALCERLPRERSELTLVTILQNLQILDVDDDTLQFIAKLAREDRSVLVRGYAVYALAGRPTKIGNDYFVSLLLTEKNSRVRIEILLALYCAGCRAVIGEIIKLLKSSHYHTQCAAIHGLLELCIDDDHKEIFREALQGLLESDAPLSVVSTAQEALESLDDS